MPVARVSAATGILNQINFQGKVVNKTVGTNIADGSYTFIFSLYSASSGGVAIWTETKSVTVTNGIFQTLLGDTTSLPGSVDFNTDNLYLGINFNSDGEMSPRVRMAAVPYAFNAKKVAGLTVTDTTGTLTIPNSTTVTDKEKLAKQPFFAQAENGDKVIIYTQAKKAILYRPAQKKIVDVAPLITDAAAQPQATPVTATAAKVSLTLLNGSAKPGVTNSFDDQLIKKYPNLKVAAKKAATKTDYAQTIVVDLTGKNTQLAAQIAVDLGGVVNALPEAEGQQNTDIVVIVGNN